MGISRHRAVHQDSPRDGHAVQRARNILVCWQRALSRGESPTPELFVVSGSLFQFRVSCEIVLNPQLRTSFLQESLDGLAGRGGLLPVEIRCRNMVLRAFLRIMIKVAGEQDRPRL